MLDRLTKQMFVDNLQTSFQLQLDATRQIVIQLIEVREGRSSPRQEQFALLFRGPQGIALGQGLWPLSHEALGAFDLFLVPVGRDQQGFLYEAVFNRLL